MYLKKPVITDGSNNIIGQDTHDKYNNLNKLFLSAKLF